ncbi:hypothetical protein [Xanthomonas sp. NCPPB 1062]|uniref:hypothetical protein n=1 Tax=Xanthomonas sp. NCPPB 1062 TaxID=487523 RepID=UPI003556F439
MSASVDVLEVLDRATGQARMVAGLAGDPQARKLLQDLASIRNAVADLLDFVRASTCHCSASTQLSSGQTLPAIICARCDALSRTGGAA